MANYERKPDFIKDIEDSYDFGGQSIYRLLTELASENKNVIGSGTEAVVINHPKDPETVVGYYYKSSSDYKHYQYFKTAQIFHTHRILSHLFPRNFPKISFVSSGPNAQNHRKKVIGNMGKGPKYSWRIFRKTIKQVENDCDQYGLPKPIFDGIANNFIVDKSGDEYYVDLLGRFDIEMWDFEALEKFIKDKRPKMSDYEKRQVMKSAERLIYTKIAKYLVSYRLKTVPNEKFIANFLASHKIKVPPEIIKKAHVEVPRLLAGLNTLKSDS